jgi:hypothetical protein
LWRDAKCHGILEANGVPFRIEIKSTGITKDPISDRKSEFNFTSGGRGGKQIKEAVKKGTESREKMVSTEDADFAFGVSSHDGTIWVFPVETIFSLDSVPFLTASLICFPPLPPEVKLNSDFLSLIGSFVIPVDLISILNGTPFASKIPWHFASLHK